jgi:hypothetical protein
MGMSPERIQEECKKRKEQRQRIQDRKAKRNAKLRNQRPAKKMRKVIPQSVDVIGKMVSFRPNPNSDILFGEVVKVKMDLIKPVNPEYPHSREYHKTISVELGDGRILNMSGDHEDLKKIRMVVES